MDSGGVHDTPLYLLSEGEMSNKVLSMCCQKFQRGRLLSTMQQCCHRCQHDEINVHKVHMVTRVKFHVGSFLGNLMDCGAVKNLDDIGFEKFKLRANYDEGVMAKNSS